MQKLFAKMLEQAGIACQALAEGIEKHTRTAEGKVYEFYLNTSEETKKVEGCSGYDILADKLVEGTLSLEKYGVAIIEKDDIQ